MKFFISAMTLMSLNCWAGPRIVCGSLSGVSQGEGVSFNLQTEDVNYFIVANNEAAQAQMEQMANQTPSVCAQGTMADENTMSASLISENPTRDPREPSCGPMMTAFKMPDGTWKCIPRYRMP